MAVKTTHMTKVKAKELKTIASEFHGNEVSICLEKEIWSYKGGDNDEVITQVWCSNCGHIDSIEDFIKIHGGE